MSKFERIETGISDLCVIKSKIYSDERGFFLETYNKKDFREIGINCEFVQDNHSKSSKGVLRGLHFQKTMPQAKLVRVIKGAVYDVAVDLRKDSKTYGKYYGVILSEENKLQFYIPKNFAHGFLVLTEEAEFTYKCDEYYNPSDEGGLIWNDKTVNIEWPIERIGGIEKIIQSDKDKILSELM